MTNSENVASMELIAAVDAILKDREVLDTFGLDVDTVRELLTVKISDKGFDLSPNFQSVGWGINDTEDLIVKLSDIGNDKAILRHELKHALHCLVCTDLFNRGLTEERVAKFKSDILEDPGFYDWRKDLNDEIAEEQWKKVEQLIEKGDIEEIKRNSLQFGSILYQHAYYLDPKMCEAAASTNDSGFAWVNGVLNSFVALYAIPGEQVLEGYGWKEGQKAFAKASIENKAMFMKKADYNREKCFGVS